MQYVIEVLPDGESWIARIAEFDIIATGATRAIALVEAQKRYDEITAEFAAAGLRPEARQQFSGRMAPRTSAQNWHVDSQFFRMLVLLLIVSFIPIGAGYMAATNLLDRAENIFHPHLGEILKYYGDRAREFTALEQAGPERQKDMQAIVQALRPIVDETKPLLAGLCGPGGSPAASSTPAQPAPQLKK